MRNTPLEEMTKERLLMGYYHLLNLTEFKKSSIIHALCKQLSSIKYGNMYDLGCRASLLDVIELLKEKL